VNVAPWPTRSQFLFGAHIYAPVYATTPGAGWYAVLRGIGWPLTEEAVEVAQAVTGVDVLVAEQVIMLPSTLEEARLVVQPLRTMEEGRGRSGHASREPTPTPSEVRSAAAPQTFTLEVVATASDNGECAIFATGVYDDTVESAPPSPCR